MGDMLHKFRKRSSSRKGSGFTKGDARLGKERHVKKQQPMSGGFDSTIRQMMPKNP